jgi:hypothetical protein
VPDVRKPIRLGRKPRRDLPPKPIAGDVIRHHFTDEIAARGG